MEKSPLVRERLVEQLRSFIAPLQGGALVKIPSERDLSEHLDASRVSVRAAIRVLVDEGRLIQLRGKGTYIVPRIGLETLSLLCSPDIKANDPFYNNFLVEITNLAAKTAIKLSMVDPERLPDSGISDPLVLIGQLPDELLDRLEKSCEALFAVQRYANREETIAQICFDDEKIGGKAAAALADHGHRRAALLGGPDKYPSARLRKAGFLAGAKRRGLAVQTVTEKMNWEGGVRAADRLFESGLPDAVFAVNDWMAAGLIQRLKERGVRVPADISVVGCDNIPLAAEFSPRIATFHLDMKLLAEELLAAIQHRLADRSAAPRSTVLPAVLIRRESLSDKK